MSEKETRDTVYTSFFALASRIGVENAYDIYERKPRVTVKIDLNGVRCEIRFVAGKAVLTELPPIKGGRTS